MKLTKWLVAILGAAAMLTSCVDDFDTNGFTVQKPGDNADYEYLNKYQPLKSYLDRNAHPNFKVSAALNAEEFNKKENIFTLAYANFDEIVAGNAMKMSSVVTDKGEFNYGTVQAFVSAAETAGLTIYGHTLAWHSQQPVKWLNTLIADKPKPVDPNAGGGNVTIVQEEVTTVTYTDGGFPFYPMGCEPPVIDGALHFEPTGDWSQFFITNAIALPEPGNYVAILKIKSSKEGKVTLTAQNGWSDQQLLNGDVNLAGTGDFEDIAIAFNGITCEPSANYDFILKPETFDAVLDVKSLTIMHLKEVAGPSTVTEDKEIATTTYTDGGFPFYPMGCEPPVVNGAIHFEPSGEWSQFFITNAISLPEPGDYSAILTIKSSKEGKITLTTQNGWSDQQLLNGDVNLTGGDDFEEVEIAFNGITCAPSANYDFILKPEMFDGVLDVKSLKIVQHITKTVGGGDAPEYMDVWTNELINSAFDPNASMESFIARGLDKNDEPAEVIVGGGPDGKNAIVIKGKTQTTNPWDTQFFVYTPNKKWEAGEKYRFHMYYKATQAVGTDTQVHGTPGDYKHWQMLSPNPEFTTEWQEKTWEGSIPSEGAGNQQSIAFNLNKNRTAGDGEAETVGQIDYYFSDITWESYSQVEVPKVEIVRVDYVNNSDMEGADASNFARKENNGQTEYVITDGVGRNGSRGVQVLSKAGAAEDWDTQFWIKLNEPLDAGETVTVQFDYKASANATGDTQAHGTPGDYAHWACIGSVDFTTEWQTYNYELSVDGSMASKGGLGSIAFNLSKDRDNDITYYFDNIKVFSEREEEIKNTIPLTPEEKRDTLVYAMKKWIDGMMDATEGKVKAWDLINEAVAGDGNVNGYYDLQHFDGYASGSWDVGGDAFYWQDYFGAENYGVVVEKMAREAYARQEEANPADLKLFVNDYNLESTWDNNKKLESLIYWIGVWEQGGAKIDGIGTQMHISYYRNAADQENQKEHITRMFEMMRDAKSPVDGHKYLVRVSELDMGIADKQFGTALKNGELTFEDEKAMADYYEWIIKEYFRIIPEDQQYGITQWCITDSPKGSGWRAEEPVGLWYLDYSRKPAYAGWAKGLGAQE